MAGRVTALRTQKGTPERVNVYVDGKFALALRLLEAARLVVGQEISDADLVALAATDLRSKAYDRALNYLSYRPRSRSEVRRNLEEAGYDPEVVEATLERLAGAGLVDDAGFAHYWVEARARFRPKGPQALRQELRVRGVDREVIDAAVAELDQEQAAYDAARVRAERLAPVAVGDPAAFRRKLNEFLLRRGFGYDVARETVLRLERELTISSPEDGDGS
jgi:regulatory protein